VPPDAIEPLLRQLVTQFVHDKARPEVVAVGINSVREICNRTPLVMTEDLLRDLSQYKKARDKPVATAARALIALFRELAPSLLEKKDRGKGADLGKSVKAYGTKEVSERVDGAELLQLERIKRKRLVAEIENMTEFDDDDDDDDNNDDDRSSDSDDEGEDDDEDDLDDDDGDEEEVEDIELSENELEENDILPVKKKMRANGKLTLAELKRRHKIAVLKAKKIAEREEKLEEEEQMRMMEEENPIEQEKIFGDEDFKKIKALRTQSKLDENLEKMGANKVVNTATADLTRLVMRKADRASERRVNPDALAAIGIRRAHDKASRMATVLAGREDSEFGSSTARHMKKTGGASNKEKAKKKQLPLAARIHAATRRRNAPVQKGKRQLGRFRKV
jgi:protein SDA1